MTDISSELNTHKKQIEDLDIITSRREKCLREKSAAEKSTLDVINKQKESNIFVQTKAFNKGKSKLDKHGVLIYTGRPGGGKTENSIAIMERYQQDHPEWCFIMYSDIHHWSEVHTDIESVILFDDCLGRTNTNTQVIAEGNNFWPRIVSSVRAGKIKVIFTVRKSIMSTNQIELEKYELFHEDHIVDLTTDEYKLTQDNKLEIFKSHCHSKNIDIYENQKNENYHQANKLGNDIPIRISIETMLRIVNTDPVIGFPFACFLYTCHTKYIVQGVFFFEKPLQVLKNDINRLKAIDSKPIEKIQYCIMVYMVLNEGHIDLEEIKEDVFKIVFESVGEKRPPNSHIQQSIEELINKYLVGDNTKFSFKHQTVLESAAICFCDDNAPLVLRYCSEKFIAEFIRPKKFKEAEGEVVVKLKQSDYKSIIQRFINSFVQKKDWAIYSFIWWVCHPLMEDKDFVGFFIEVFKSNETALDSKEKICRLIEAALMFGKIDLLNGLYSIDNDEIKSAFKSNICIQFYKTASSKNRDIVVWLRDHELGADKAFEAIQFARESTLLATIINHPKLKEVLRSNGSKVFNKWPDIDVETYSRLFIDCCRYRETDSVESIISISRKQDLITPQAVIEGFRCACSYGNLNVVNLLLNHYFDLIHTPEMLNEGFSLSCAMGEVEMLDFLINIANSKSNATSKQQLDKGFIFASPLLKQFYNLPYELIKNEDELTNLHVAALFGRYAVVKKVIDLGLNIRNETRSGISALQFAITGFICKGMNIEFVSYITNRESMFLSNYLRYCKRLGKNGLADVSMYTDTLIYLIKHRDCKLSDLDITLDRSGSTIAHYCVVYDCLSVIELLCEVRPSLMTIRNTNNHRPLDLAVLMGRDEMFKLLYFHNTHINSNTIQSQQQFIELHKLFSNGKKCINCLFGFASPKRKPDFLSFLPKYHLEFKFGTKVNYKEIEQIILVRPQE